MSPAPWRQENREVIEQQYREHHEAAKYAREQAEKHAPEGRNPADDEGDD